MGKPTAPYANRGPIDYAAISPAVPFDPPIRWIQVLSAGSGGLVVKDEGGIARTYASLSAGDTLAGPFTEITSMTLTKIRVGDGPAPAPVPVSALLGSTVAGNGASLIGSSDIGGFTSKTTTEEQVQELYQHLFSANGGTVALALSAFREVDATGDVGAITANGGVLASDTTPVYDALATTNDHEILWATGNVDPIGISIALPADFDDTANATLDLTVASGTTNAATIVVASSWDSGSEVSDSTSDTATKSATAHTLAVVIDATDIPAGASRVTFRLTPPTHATDTISLRMARLKYKRKLLLA